MVDVDVTVVKSGRRKWLHISLIVIICLLLITLIVALCVLFFGRQDNSASDRNCTTYQCGIPKVNSKKSMRIVGGTTVSPYSWPWQGALMKKSGISYFMTCGATLISNQWLMTAAHCVYNDPNPYNYMLPYGIQCNDHIIPVCLPDQDAPLPAVGRLLTITGWGAIEQGSEVTSATLREIQVPLVHETLCKITYDVTVNYVYSFCAGLRQGGKDACQGDSGGPAVYRPSDQDPWIQLGITSWGDGCGKPYKPGVYTRVSSYINWIKQYVVQ